MNDIIKLVKTYRVSTGLSERLRLADEIIHLIRPDLLLFIFKAVQPPADKDVLQETLKAIAIGMGKFKGDSNEVFWGWCYRIARNKRNNHYREKKTAERTQSMPPEEISQLVDVSAQGSPLSPADKHDLGYAMKLLVGSQPECGDYLWDHFVFGLDYAEIAEQRNLNYDNVRMKIRRCLDEAKSLVS